MSYGSQHSNGIQHHRYGPYASNYHNNSNNVNDYSLPQAPAHLPPVHPIQIPQNGPHISQDPLVQQLLQPRPRPGNPRPRQVYINKYGTFESPTEPDFDSVDCFDWVYYGFDTNENKYTGIFRNIANRQSIQQIKNLLNLTDITISKLSMRQRADKYDEINEICDEITHLFEDNNPFKASSKQTDKEAIRKAIADAIEENLTPEQFRLQQPEISSNKTTKIWYQNVFDAKKKEREKLEEQEAVDWLQLNALQQQIVQMVEEEWNNYNAQFNTNAKKILMGNRNMFVIVSPDGGVGITTTSKYMRMKHGSDKVILISGGGKPSDVIYNYHSQLQTASNCQFLFWNVARADYKDFRWTCVEEISDALSTSNKYNSQTKSEAPPVLCCVTNKLFALKNMTTNEPLITLDRINLFRVRRSVVELERVDVYEYYLKKYGDDPRVQEQKEDSDFDIADL